jgi:hypothetical protein
MNEWRHASVSHYGFYGVIVELTVLGCLIRLKMNLVARVHTCNALKVLLVGARMAVVSARVFTSPVNCYAS